MPHLTRVSWKSRPDRGEAEAFPFSVAAVRSLVDLDLSARVTFFVGENGTGKSTLLEGIAAAAELPTVGSADAVDDPSLAAQRALGNSLRLTWTRRSRRGFYMRAEDFFGYLRRMARDDARLAREARGPSSAASRLDPEDSRHPDEMDAEPRLAGYDARSHGESFLDLFRSRVHPKGLYLLDEPEAPLSPQRQLAFLSMLADATRGDAQFVIATHSPILLAFPGSRIYSFDAAPIRAVDYADLEHVTLTRDFLTHTDRYLRLLGASEP
ncbi:MAG: ABC transporter, ATP-binding protein [uncultured Gemmatimonadetes bacterium]|uniref:ABC transporter, ATP-binding protein n=1 Tax=uncultured Gemmatimonadota bacterium TaxID=203437 RepID=A0A6J4MTV2_9BACT|nr:MAG: ABC transporter, ATP-binding protein [uncultured Gemmatimonadota bacterium]